MRGRGMVEDKKREVERLKGPSLQLSLTYPTKRSYGTCSYHGTRRVHLCRVARAQAKVAYAVASSPVFRMTDGRAAR